MFGKHPATADREVGTARGAGGDRTLVIDSAAEDVVFAELEALHARGPRLHGDLRGARQRRRTGTAPARCGS